MSALQNMVKKVILLLSALGLMLAFSGCSASDASKQKAPEKVTNIAIGADGVDATQVSLTNNTGKSIKEVSIKKTGDEAFSKLAFTKGTEFKDKEMATLYVPAEYVKAPADEVEKDGDPDAAKVNHRPLIDLLLNASEEEKYEVNQLPIETLKTLTKTELRFDTDLKLIYFAGETKDGEKFDTLESQKALKAAAKKAEAEKQETDETDKAASEQEASKKTESGKKVTEKSTTQKAPKTTRTQKQKAPANKQKPKPAGKQSQSSNIKQESNPCEGQGDPGWR